jgi:hypothetical protein
MVLIEKEVGHIFIHMSIFLIEIQKLEDRVCDLECRNEILSEEIGVMEQIATDNPDKQHAEYLEKGNQDFIFTFIIEIQILLGQLHELKLKNDSLENDLQLMGLRRLED